MKPRVYVETSVISYLAARPSKDAIKASRQLQARALWDARAEFSLFVSPAVIDEALRGSPSAAALRMEYAAQLPLFEFKCANSSFDSTFNGQKSFACEGACRCSAYCDCDCESIEGRGQFQFQTLGGCFRTL